MSSTLTNLEWRYATKAYDAAKKLSREQLHIIKEALRLAPSSFGLQPWKFVHVTDAALREKLKAAAWNQSPVTDASDLFVLCSIEQMDETHVDRYIADVAAKRSMPVEALKGYRDMMVGAVIGKGKEGVPQWNALQVYLALGVALAAAAENGIDSTPMEGFDPAKFDEILGLADLGLHSRVLLAVGFRSQEDAAQHYKKVRFEEGQVFIQK